jgi:hypothetical protein
VTKRNLSLPSRQGKILVLNNEIQWSNALKEEMESKHIHTVEGLDQLLDVTQHGNTTDVTTGASVS